MAMLQGDSYSIPFFITDGSGRKVEPDEIATIEFCIGSIAKYYPQEITYNRETAKFLLPLTQEETISLKANLSALQVRVKFENGNVIGTNLKPINVSESITKKVIE